MRSNYFVHLLHCHAVWVYTIVLQDMVGAVTAVIDRVLTQRIDKRIDMPAGLPHLLIHQNSRIHAVHVVALIHKVLPPPEEADMQKEYISGKKSLSTAL